MEQALSPPADTPAPIIAAAAVALPTLNEGETYIGCYGGADGKLQHVILLPGDNGDAPWKAQMDWAKSIGGDLPNRIEQSMLYENHDDIFNPDWYWSNTQHASVAGCAWYQYFLNGTQSIIHINCKLRARAVRRLPI